VSESWSMIGCPAGPIAGLPSPGWDSPVFWLSESTRDGSKRWHGPIELVGPNPGRARMEMRCRPNPFQAEVAVSLNLPAPAAVRVEVFDVVGRTVAVLHDDYREAGLLSLNWDGRAASGQAVSSGIYFVRASVDGYAVVRRLIRTR